VLDAPRVLLGLAAVIALGSAVLLIADHSLVSAWLTLVAGVSLAVVQLPRMRQ
jgi:hypothetical protein